MERRNPNVDKEKIANESNAGVEEIKKAIEKILSDNILKYTQLIDNAENSLFYKRLLNEIFSLESLKNKQFNFDSDYDRTITVTGINSILVTLSDRLNKNRLQEGLQSFNLRQFLFFIKKLINYYYYLSKYNEFKNESLQSLDQTYLNKIKTMQIDGQFIAKKDKATNDFKQDVITQIKKSINTKITSSNEPPMEETKYSENDLEFSKELKKDFDTIKQDVSYFIEKDIATVKSNFINLVEAEAKNELRKSNLYDEQKNHADETQLLKLYDEAIKNFKEYIKNTQNRFFGLRAIKITNSEIDDHTENVKKPKLKKLTKEKMYDFNLFLLQKNISLKWMPTLQDKKLAEPAKQFNESIQLALLEKNYQHFKKFAQKSLKSYRIGQVIEKNINGKLETLNINYELEKLKVDPTKSLKDNEDFIIELRNTLNRFRDTNYNYDYILSLKGHPDLKLRKDVRLNLLLTQLIKEIDVAIEEMNLPKADNNPKPQH